MKKILFLLKNYNDNSETFLEYLKLFEQKGFQTRVFDIGLAHKQKGRVGYIAAVLKEIKKFNPDYIYVADEIFSRNVLFIALAKKAFFYKYKIIAFIASQYVLKSNRIKASFLLKNVDFMFCRNKKELQKIKQMPLFKNSKNIYQVYLGVSENIFYRTAGLQKNYFGKDRYVLGFIGRIVPEKGLDIILECLAKLPENFVLLVAGKKDNFSYQKKVQDFIEKNNLEKRVVWLENVKEKELKYVYGACDLAVMPTTQKYNNFLELFGSVIAESMLCRTLIIGSSNGSIPEVIARPDLIFEEDNTNDLLRAINYVYNLSPEEKERIIAENYNMAKREYSSQAFVGAITKAISQ